MKESVLVNSKEEEHMTRKRRVWERKEEGERGFNKDI